MHIHHLEFKIDQMRKDKMILALETIVVFILALFVTAILPQLLFQFLFADKQLTAEPPLIKYIPVISFVAAILYFFYATFSVMMKKMKINQLEKEIAMMMIDSDDCCSDGSCDCGHDHGHSHHDWMDEGMDMADEMTETVSKPKRKTAAKKKTSKK
jgi:ABC-type multidrug transport system fused ATPase/permease subunit